MSSLEPLTAEPLDMLRTRRSAKWRTYPRDVLPLALAEMDFAVAPEISTVLRDAVSRSDLGYAAPGTELGDAFAGFAARHWGWTVRPSWVTAVTDVGLGVIELLRLFTRPGDTVVISPPVYPPFLHWPHEAGLRKAEVPLLRGRDGYHLDLPGLEQAFARRPAAYILCNPQNPVGCVHSAAEIESVVDLARRYDVRLISDEIFGPLTFPEAPFTPLLTVRGAEQVGVSVLSASKAFNIAGLKCAVIVAGSTATADALRNLPREISWRAGHLGVIASVAAFTHGDQWLARLLLTLESRRALLASLVPQRVPAVSWHQPAASYLAWLDCSGLGLADAGDTFLARGRVALDKGEPYGGGGKEFVRLNFATSPEILDQATAAMAAAISVEQTAAGW
jgi:cystathionine beta-lyase